MLDAWKRICARWSMWCLNFGTWDHYLLFPSSTCLEHWAADRLDTDELAFACECSVCLCGWLEEEHSFMNEMIQKDEEEYRNPRDPGLCCNSITVAKWHHFVLFNFIHPAAATVRLPLSASEEPRSWHYILSITSQIALKTNWKKMFQHCSQLHQ